METTFKRIAGGMLLLPLPLRLSISIHSALAFNVMDSLCRCNFTLTDDANYSFWFVLHLRLSYFHCKYKHKSTMPRDGGEKLISFETRSLYALQLRK